MLHQELNDKDILKSLLRDYFSSIKLELPEDFILREFAFQDYASEKYIRHMSFQSLASLREFLVNKTPINSYYSAAVYRDPAATAMEDKGLIGAELMFDIDSDHIEECNPVILKLEGRELHIMSEKCIELGKRHELRLLDILMNDFGFSKNEIRVYFTGNRGFHTVVRPKDEEWFKLGSRERRELIDYIKGVGLKLGLILPRKVKNIDKEGLIRCGGWRRRILSRNFEIEEVFNSPEDAVKSVAVEIDEQVTQDLSRLIRIPNTLNGKTGMPVTLFKTENDFLSFKYCEELSPFKGRVLVKSLSTTSRFEIWDYSIQLVKDQTILLPLPLAVYLSLNKAVKMLRIM